MRYISTRGRAPALGFCDTLLAGLASDGGLYVPERWPALPAVRPGASYARVAAGVVGAFAGDELEPAVLERLCTEAYAGFRHPAVCPLVQLDAGEWLLELFHGPTLAFKDLALQLVGRLFDHVLSERGLRITVLVATSGDTGSAAIAGLASCRSAEIVVLYPEGRVSDVQRRQMTTVDAPNVHAVAVEGTFDDCQRIVKELFGDAALRERVGLAAMNSINWARIAAQVAYYAWATASLGGRGLAFAVPTGNFGNVLSGWVARASGMPLERLVIGSNANDILPRLRRERTARGARRGAHAQPEHGHPDLLQPRAAALRALRPRPRAHGARAGGVRRDRLADAGLHRARDPARAVRRRHAERRRDALGDARRIPPKRDAARPPYRGRPDGRAQVQRCGSEAPLVALATAHAAKFPDAVERATGIAPSLPPPFADLLERPERSERVPADAAAVRRLLERVA